MEVIGAVASFIAIGQGLESGLKLVNFVREIPEVEGDYKALKREIRTIGYMLKTTQDVVSRYPDHADSPLIVEAIQQLKDVEVDITEVATKCCHLSGEKKGEAKKRRWLLEGSKIKKLHMKAADARLNLHFALTCHLGLTMNTRQEQFNVQMRVMSREVSSLASLQSYSIQTQPQTLPEVSSLDGRPRVEMVEDNVSAAPRTQVEQQESPPKVTPNEVNGTAYPYDEAITQLQESLYRTRNGCAAWCRCVCHFDRTDYTTRSWLRPLVGSLSVRHNAFLGSNKPPCTERDCTGGGPVAFMLKHQFPKWLWGSILRFNASYDPLSGLQYSSSLRPARILANHENVWYQMKKGLNVFCKFIGANPHYFPDDMDDDGEGLIEYAIRDSLFDILEFLVRLWKDTLSQKGLPRSVAISAYDRLGWYGGELDQRKKYLLHQAIELVEDGPAPNRTKLHQALLVNDKNSLQEALREEPWTINVLDRSGAAPFHAVSSLGNLAALEILIAANADIEAEDWERLTPLMHAVINDRLNCVQRLLQAGCCVDAREKRGTTALHYAMYHASPDMVANLLMAGASVKTVDKYGATALHHLASSTTSPQATQEKLQHLLMVKDLDLERVDQHGDTPLLRCLWYNNLALLQGLVEAGASLHSTNRRTSENLLHLAGLHCGVDILNYLVGLELSGINPYLEDRDGDSPWDNFQWAVHGLEWKLSSTRRPTAEEQAAFVRLYKGIRDRNLQHDAEMLERVAGDLSRKDKDASRAKLAPLIKQTEEWKRYGLLETFRAIDGLIRTNDWQYATEAIQDVVEELREEMTVSPWDIRSPYTPGNGVESSTSE